MATPETIAALERAAALCEQEGRRWSEPGPERADAATIRDHIETLRNGGERAKVVAYLRQCEAGGITGDLDTSAYGWAADAIASGAHEEQQS